MNTIAIQDQPCRSTIIRTVLATFLIGITLGTNARTTGDQPITICSDGWELRADLRFPVSSPTRAFAVLLHKAAGNRTAYVQMAEIWVLPGEGHATDLFDENPDLHLKLLDWIDEHLPTK